MKKTVMTIWAMQSRRPSGRVRTRATGAVWEACLLPPRKQTTTRKMWETIGNRTCRLDIPRCDRPPHAGDHGRCSKAADRAWGLGSAAIVCSTAEIDGKMVRGIFHVGSLGVPAGTLPNVVSYDHPYLCNHVCTIQQHVQSDSVCLL